MKSKVILSAGAVFATFLALAPAEAAWKPTKSIEFVVTSGPGGGTDQLARTIQQIIVNHNLVDVPITVVNKPGGSGAEGYVYVKSLQKDPYRVLFGTSNTWQQPLVSKVAFKYTDFTPLAIMAQDEFMLWVKMDSAYKTAQDYIQVAKEKELQMGGGYSKDTDEVLTRLITKATGAKLLYIPFKSGNEAAVQLAGGHVESNVNNPAESIGQWRGNTQRPLCVFRPTRLPEGLMATDTVAWHDVPTCVEAGIDISQYQQPRTLWLAAGVTPDQLAFYVDLMKKVQQQPEWKKYIERTLQSDTFLAGKDFADFIAKDEANLRDIAAEQGWLVAN